MALTHIASVRVNPERASAAPQPRTLTSGQPRADERLRPPARAHSTGIMMHYRLQLFATATSANFSFNSQKNNLIQRQNNIFWITLQFQADPIYYENTGLERMNEAEEADCSVFTNRIAGFHGSHVGVHHDAANHILETCLRCRQKLKH